VLVVATLYIGTGANAESRDSRTAGMRVAAAVDTRPDSQRDGDTQAAGGEG